MEDSLLKDKFLGCLVGLAVGDALGTTNEFKAYKDVRPITDIVGGGMFNLNPGEWTDDTTMALCLAESLIEKNNFDSVNQMQKYVAWYRNGYHSVKDHCFDIGGATRSAIEHFERTGSPVAIDKFAEGNGAIMRLAPIPLFYHRSFDIMMKMCKENSITTHNAMGSIQTCELMGAIIYMCLNSSGYKECITNSFSWPFEVYNFFDSKKFLHEKIHNIIKGTYKYKTPPKDDKGGDECVSGNAHAPSTLEAALWGFHNTDNFKDGALAVVNLGGDADTTGAVYGQIAGAYYGLSGIPKEWVDKIYNIELIKDYATKLYELNQSNKELTIQ